MIPEIVHQIAFLILGLAILLVAGDLLVRGAVGLAAALKVQAVLTGNDGIALGNIIGSNIANVFLVLGLPALIYPITTHVVGLRRHAIIMLLATAAFIAAAYGPGYIDTAIGGGLFVGIIAYVAYMWIRASIGNANDPVIDEVEEYQAASGVSLKTMLFLAAGLVGLPLGAHLLVSNGASLAMDLGVREELIGLTIVAFGTSLPELATVMAAAFHKKSDVAIGGVIGSNIFNLLAVGGAAGLAGTAVFDPESMRVDIPVMIVASIAVAAYVLTRRDIGRPAGALFFLAYIGFIFLLAALAGGV